MDEEQKMLITPQLLLIQRQLDMEKKQLEKEKAQQKQPSEKAQKNFFKKFSMWEEDVQIFLQSLRDYYRGDAQSTLNDVNKYIYNEGILQYFNAYRDELRKDFLLVTPGSSRCWRLNLTPEDMKRFRLQSFQRLYIPHIVRFIKPEYHPAAQIVFRAFKERIADAHKKFDRLQGDIVNKAHGKSVEDVTEYCLAEYKTALQRCQQEIDPGDPNPVTVTGPNGELIKLIARLPVTYEKKTEINSRYRSPYKNDKRMD